MSARKNKLRFGARYSLFTTSYFPLFFIIIIRQISHNWEYLQWGGFSKETILNFIHYFGFATLLVIVSIIGFIGLNLFILNIGKSTNISGTKVLIKNVKNRNNDSISYIGTYIIPFLFQDYTSYADILSIIILLVVIYFIYSRSSLLVINPTLNIVYALYEVEYIDNFNTDNAKTKNGLIITKEKFLKEDDIMLFKKIGHKLYFSINKGREID